MQVNSSVNTRYHASYRSNKGEKYCDGISKRKGDRIGRNKRNENQEVAEFLDYQKILEEKINELYVKVKNGDTEPAYQIGAQSFTEKEWDEFLEKFDSAEEAVREIMESEQERKMEGQERNRAEHERKMEGQERKRAEQLQEEKAVLFKDESSLLTTDSTSCTYPTADPNDDDIRYITWYTEEGIFCRKAGQTEEYEWFITLENGEQYEKVMDFIGQFTTDWNLRFAAHENFWEDFLNDDIDIEGFMDFMDSTNKGVPDFSITVGDSMYIDKEKVQWAKYTNPLGTRFYTEEKM